MSELTRRTALPWVALATLIAIIMALGTAIPAQADAPDTPVIETVQTYQQGQTRTVVTWELNREKREWRQVETQVTSCSAPHLIVTWSGVAGADSYTAQYRDADNGGDWKRLLGQKKKGNSVVAGTPPIKVNVKYDIRIAAVKDGTTGGFATGETKVGPDTGAPTNLTATASTERADAAILSWTNAPGNSPTQFAIQRREGEGQWQKASIYRLRENEATAPIFNLKTDVEHHFRVAPQSSFCTYNNWSNTASITLVRKPPTPTATVTAGHQGNTPVVTVTATANPRTDSYKLRHRQTGATSYTETTLTTSAATAGHVITGLSASTEYEVGLAAVNQYGDSGYATSTVTTGEVIVVPEEPEFSLTAGHRNEETVITATVSAHDQANASYTLKFRKSTEEDWSTPVAVTKTAAGAGYVIDVEADTSYDVAMAGVNGSRTSAYAEETIRSELEWFVPSAPAFTAAARHKGAQAVIAVQVPNGQPGVTSYTLEVTKQVDGTTAATQSLTPAQATAGYDHAVEHNATYSVRMSATGRNGDSAFSAATTVTAPPPLPKQPEFSVAAGHSNKETVLTVTVTNADEHTSEYLITTQEPGDDTTAATTTETKAAATAGVEVSVEPDTQYSVSVKGRNSGGTGTAATTTVRSLTPFPAKPQATVTAGYDAQKRNIITVTVTSPDTHTTGYTVAHQETGAEGTPTTATVTKAAATAGHVILVEPSTGYTITVTGNNSHGAGKSSEYTVTSLVEVKIPDQPVIAVAPAYGASNKSVLRVNVSNHDADTTRYDYTLSMTGVDDVTGTVQSDSDAATFSFDIPAASPGVYSVSVKAYIGTEGSDTATASATAWASYVAGVVLSKTSVTLSEGKTYEVYTVSLSQAPAAQGKVTLEITPGNDGAAHVLSQHIGEFDSGNWSAGQVLYTVLPSAPESAGEMDFVHRLLLDGKATGNTATLSVTVSQP